MLGCVCSSVGSIKSGDLIVEIDGIDTRGLQVHDVTEMLRGPPSTDVRMVSASFSCLVRTYY
jgi:C-terminal processing protease CtpA/Prc